MVNNDMSNQNENLKKRLEERKQKKLLSTSDCTEAIETLVRKFIIPFSIRKIKL